MARRGCAALRRPSTARSPRRGGAPAIMAPTISSTRRGKRSRQPRSPRSAPLTLFHPRFSRSFLRQDGTSSLNSQQYEEFFLRKMYERIDQKVDQLFGQMHEGPSNPVLTSPSSQQSSCASVTPPEMDLAHYHADDITVGKDVILYAMLRSYLPVAKGTVISTNPSTMLGGRSLGRQFCQVVNLVLKRDAFLPRPYAEMETMADAYMKSIAWPYNKLKLSNKASILSQGTAGTSKKC